MEKSTILVLTVLHTLCLLAAPCSCEESDLPESNDSTKSRHCKCVEYDCGCCAQLVVPKLMNGKLCSNFSYLPDQYGVSATITYKNFPIYNETVSLKNPPHICVVHVDEIKMEICFRLYDLDIKNKCFSGCAEFEIEFFKVVPFKKLELGCFGCKNKSNWSYASTRLRNDNNDHENDKKQPPEVLII